MKLFLSVLLSTCAFVMAEPVCPGSPSATCYEDVPAANPDGGKKLFVNSNAGGVNNENGGGLSGKKCEELNPNCDVCAPGFKNCEICSDFSSEGGFAFENVGGVCGVKIDFEELSGTIARVPQGYRDMTWTNLSFINGPWYKARKAGYENTGYYQMALNTGSVYQGWKNGGGVIGSFSAASGFTFSLKSMKITSAWQKNVVVTIEGFDEDLNLRGEATLVTGELSDIIDFQFDSTFESIWKVSIQSSGGTYDPATNNPPCSYLDCSHVVVDDIVIV